MTTSRLSPLWRGIDRLSYLLTVLAALAVTASACLVILQVFYRYILSTPIGWTQELSIFCTIFAVMIGIGPAFWHGQHFHMNLLVDKTPRPVGFTARIVTDLASALFVGVVAYNGYSLAMRAMRQISPTSGIPMGYIQFFMVVGCTLACALIVARILRSLTTRVMPEDHAGGPEETHEGL